MNNKKSTYTRNINILIYLSSFLVSAVGMLLIMKARGFYPFNDSSMFVMDMWSQYVEFFASLRYVISGENSLFFSWSRSLGGNYLGLFAYYIASPLSFITLLFPVEEMPLAIAVLSVIKIGLCGLTFSVYANYLWTRHAATTTDSLNLSHKWTQLLIIPFSTAYALMSYNITYLCCLMWLDGVILLPLVLLGVEKILDGKKGGQYILALTALFFCNYYTGYMIGIYTAIYIIYRSVVRLDLKNIKESLKETFFKLLRFTLCTLLSLGLSAPLLLPVIKDLFTGRIFAGKTNYTELSTYEPFGDIFNQFKNGAYISLDNSGLPSIYCGYLALLFAVLFLFMRKISIREKVGALLILVIFFASFYLLDLDTFWHGFKLPACFPYRYAFLFSFTLLYMVIRTLSCIFKGGIPTIWQRKPIYECILVLTMLITATDLGINGKDILFRIGDQFAYCPVDEYNLFLNTTKPLVESIKKNDDGFYRINQGYSFSKNDAMLLGYNGMTHYSSTFNESVNTLTSDLGLAQAHFWNAGYGSNPLLDSLLAVKYALSQQHVPSEYTLLQTTGQWEENALPTSSYLNENALSFLYSAPVSTLTPEVATDNPFVNQNHFANAIAGTDESFFTEYETVTTQTENGWIYTFTADSNNPVYFFLDTDEYRLSYDPANVLVNGNVIGGYFTDETLCCLYIGSFAAGQEVIVQIPSQTLEPNAVYVAQLHMETVTPILQSLQEKGIHITHRKGASIEGIITVDEGDIIMTSIPYDTGWTVKIDGRKAETVQFADTFLAIPIESGEHTISLSYVSPGFYVGILSFGISLMFSILYLSPIIGIKNKKHK